jgi:hypothetical protein
LRLARQKRLQPGGANKRLVEAARLIAGNPCNMLTRCGFVIGPRRDKHASPAKRRDEIFGNLGKQTLDDDPVERANVRQDRQAIAKDDPGIGDAEPGTSRESLARSAVA